MGKKVYKENHSWLFDRGVVHRGVCLKNINGLDYNKTAQYVRNSLNKDFARYNLSVVTELFSCIHSTPEPNKFDNLIILVIGLTIFLVALGTILDKIGRRPETNIEKVAQHYSLIKNWKKVCETNGNGDFMRLKSIQGLRVAVMIYVISIHSCLKCFGVMFEDPDEVEKFVYTPLWQFVMSTTGLMVNNFFFISAFLLTNQIYNIYNRNGTFSLSDSIVLLLNRYFRCIAATLFVVTISQLTWFEKYVGPGAIKAWTMNLKGCQMSWYSTVFMFNNYLYMEEMCYGTTWYLAGDFQAYIIVTLILYLMFKYEIKAWKTMSICLLSSSVVYGAVIYYYGLNIIFNLMDVDWGTCVKWLSFKMLYAGLHSTLPVSFVGMIFGAVYNRAKYNNFKRCSYMNTLLWSILFGGLPLMAIGISFLQYNRLGSAILGAIVKLIFVSGPAVGVLGMAYGLGGYVKKIFEWKYLVVISNISFSTYIFNLFTLLLGGTYSSLVKFNKFVLIEQFLICLFVSMIGGLLLTLLVELPGQSLQKIWFPQVIKKDKTK